MKLGSFQAEFQHFALPVFRQKNLVTARRSRTCIPMFASGKGESQSLIFHGSYPYSG